MSTGNHRITIKNDADQFKKARSFIFEELNKMHVTKQRIRENGLLFEEIFLRIAEQYKEEKPEITISLTKKISEVKILIEFSGKRFDIDFQSSEDENLGASILRRYEDKIGLSYIKGRNSISIVIKRTYDKMSAMCCGTMLLAVIVYGAAKIFLSDAALVLIYDNAVFPLEKFFTNTITLIAGPVTFFSIVTNITACYVIADSRISLGKLELRAVLSSLLAEAVAVIYFIFLKSTYSGSLFAGGEIYNVTSVSASFSLVESFWQSFADDILHPFRSSSPLPMLTIALAISSAVCSMNKHFKTIKEMIDAVNDLFSRVLSTIMAFIPIAAFLAILDALIEYGFAGLLVVLMVVLLLLGGVLLMFAVAMIKVALYGIDPFDYMKKCLPAVVENFKINSSIDAVAYNIRFCNKTFGISLDKLDTKIPILAQIDQTGNCFAIMIAALFLMYFTKIDITTATVITLGILVIFVAMGAPGQDGSLLIGLVMIFQSVGISLELVAAAIYLEATIGRMLPVLNSLFDITSVVTEEKRASRKTVI